MLRLSTEFGRHDGTRSNDPHPVKIGKRDYKAIGDLSELPDHLCFDAAQKAAQRWFEHLGRSDTAVSPTVADGCATYVRHLRATKSQRAVKDAEARFKNYVLNDAKLAATELPKLTPTQLEGWRKFLSASSRCGPGLWRSSRPTTSTGDERSSRMARTKAAGTGESSCQT